MGRKGIAEARRIDIDADYLAVNRQVVNKAVRFGELGADGEYDLGPGEIVVHRRTDDGATEAQRIVIGDDALAGILCDNSHLQAFGQRGYFGTGLLCTATDDHHATVSLCQQLRRFIDRSGCRHG